MRHALAPLVACALFALPAAAPPVPRGPVVTTLSGPVVGTLRGEVRTFAGIPYAAPPVGPLRFAAPAAPVPWTAPRDATHPGALCPQLVPLPPKTRVAEDCLNLNVTAPVRGSGLPVLVFLHGGGFMHGGRANLDGAALAAHGIVVVTINYRLGILGWLAHPALDDGDGNTGNYGLEDQQAALRWVKSNIAAFGGDPARVTLGGESAGAMSTCLNEISPAGHGLFARAIVESGPCTSTWPTLQKAETIGSAAAVKLGCTIAATIVPCLRRVKLAEILRVQASFPGITFQPSVGGSDIPQQPRTAIGSMPTLLGGNRFEAGYFVATGLVPSNEPSYVAEIERVYGQSLAPRVLAEYPYASFPDGYTALSAAETDANPANPFITWCLDVADLRLQAATSTPIFGYEFADAHAPGTPAAPGPVHTAELPYLFPSPNVPLSPASRSLSATMIGYWANFVTTGDPNGPDLPRWPVYRTPTDVLQLIPRAVAFGRDVAAEHQCAFWTAAGITE
jgi:para-nitrobenzyl esterase